MKTLFFVIQKHGDWKSNRTGVRTLGIFGYQMRFNLGLGFPLCTAKYVPFKLIAVELLWFLRGDQDQPGSIDFLHQHNCHIWDEWSKGDGSFGPVYGVQWRKWLNFYRNPVRDVDGETIDQLELAVQTLKVDPMNRRIMVSAWNPAEVPDMQLPPCHTLFQFNARPIPDDYLIPHDGKGPPPAYFLDCHLYQRSCDSFLGVPFNIASYALLTHMVAHVVNMVPGDFVWTGGDVHIYENHIDQVGKYLDNPLYPLPGLKIVKPAENLDEFTLEHFELQKYQHAGIISADVVV